MSAVPADVEPGDLRPDGTPADAPPGWDGDALGTETNIASTPGGSGGYGSRWSLLRRARALLRGRERRRGDKGVPFRVTKCQYTLQRDDRGLEVMCVRVERTETRAFFRNVIQCGSVWTCPVCAARVAARRRHELRDLERRAAAQGLAIGLHTLTFSHGAGDDLEDLLTRLSAARRILRSGRAWQRFRRRWGWIGEARTLELTHGGNGWHPHYHSLHFCEATPAGHDRTRFRRELYLLWARSCRRAGLGLPSYRRGVHVAWGSRDQAGRSLVADYIAKWGFAGEVSGAQAKWRTKGGRTPWQLLEASGRDAYAARLWRDYAAALDGRHQLQLTPGLRKRLDVQLELDVDAADPRNEPGSAGEPEPVGSIDFLTWNLVCRYEAHEEILEAALEGAEAFAGAIAALHQRDGPPADFVLESDGENVSHPPAADR